VNHLDFMNRSMKGCIFKDCIYIRTYIGDSNDKQGFPNDSFKQVYKLLLNKNHMAQSLEHFFFFPL